MKKFVIDLFRHFPICTGLLGFLIALHIVGIKDLRTPMMEMQDDLWLLFALYCFVMMFFMLFILPKVERQKREKLTWSVVASNVVVLTIVAKIFI